MLFARCLCRPTDVCRANNALVGIPEIAERVTTHVSRRYSSPEAETTWFAVIPDEVGHNLPRFVFLRVRTTGLTTDSTSNFISIIQNLEIFD